MIQQIFKSVFQLLIRSRKFSLHCGNVISKELCLRDSGKRTLQMTYNHGLCLSRICGFYFHAKLVQLLSQVREMQKRRTCQLLWCTLPLVRIRRSISFQKVVLFIFTVLTYSMRTSACFLQVSKQNELVRCMYVLSHLTWT